MLNPYRRRQEIKTFILLISSARTEQLSTTYYFLGFFSPTFRSGVRWIRQRDPLFSMSTRSTA